MKAQSGFRQRKKEKEKTKQQKQTKDKNFKTVKIQFNY